jgi:hypothetical protein
MKPGDTKVKCSKSKCGFGIPETNMISLLKLFSQNTSNQFSFQRTDGLRNSSNLPHLLPAPHEKLREIGGIPC